MQVLSLPANLSTCKASLDGHSLVGNYWQNYTVCCRWTAQVACLHWWRHYLLVFVSGIFIQLLNTVDSFTSRAISLPKIISHSLQSALTLSIYSVLNCHAVSFILVR